MPLSKIAKSNAHRILAKLLSLGATPPGEPVTAVARDESDGLQVVITISKYAPMRISDDTLSKIAAFSASQEAPKCPSGKSSPPTLRDVESAALKATVETPVTVKALARLAGYAYGSHFRDAVRRLIDAGLIVRVTGGVKRA